LFGATGMIGYGVLECREAGSFEGSAGERGYQRARIGGTELAATSNEVGTDLP